MDDLFRMPGAFPFLKAVGLAAKARLAATVFPNPAKQKHVFEQSIRSNEASCLGSLGNRNWWNDGLLSVLQEAWNAATDLGIKQEDLEPEHIRNSKNARDSGHPKRKHKQMQKLFTENVTDRLYPTSANQLFCKRFQRWGYMLDGAIEWAAERAELLQRAT